MSLKWRFIVIATLAMLAAVVVVGVTTTHDFGARYEAAIQSRSNAIAQGLKTQLERLLQFGLPLNELTGFEEQCREVVQAYRGVESAFVADAAGKVLFHSDPLAPGRVAERGLLDALGAGLDGVVDAGAGGHASFYTVTPLFDPRGDHLGSVVIATSGELAAQELRETLLRAAAVGAGALLAGIALLHLTLSAFVTRPLQRLIDTIAGLREHPTDLGRRAVVDSRVELGGLAGAFNSLMGELQQTTVARSELVAALETLRQTSDELFEQKERAEVTLGSIADGVVATDAEGRVRYLNPVAEGLTGWRRDQALGRPVETVLVLVEAGSDELRPLPLPPQAAGPAVEADLLRRDGVRIGVDQRGAEIRDRAGRLAGRVLTFRDVSTARDAARRRSWEATHDQLTGLANRRGFETRLEAAMAACRIGGASHVVCFMDLDRFKVVNDTCGHAAGDELLKQVTALMRSKVRQSDTLARLGGDEFALLLEHCTLERAERIAGTVLAAVRELRFEWKGRTLHVGLSVGLAALDAEVAAAEALSRADTACYLAKEQGRERVCVFNTGDGDMAARRREAGWVARLESALAQDRFVLHQQRFLALNDAAAQRRHLEVLLRMVDEDGALVMPGSFVPAAERYNLMPQLDRWVIRRVFAGYHALQQRAGGALTCAINLSGTSLNSPGMLEFIRAQATAHAIPPGAICFEITETSAIANLRQALALLDGCRALGIEFALDDFGSGASSFGYLKNLPVDYLKIDGSFVRQLADDRVDRAMTETINHLGHLLGIRTVAECAEDEAIIERLREIGVDYAQGYGVERPNPLFADEPATPWPSGALLAA